MSFEIQDLPDILRIITLIGFSKAKTIPLQSIRKRIDRICAHHVTIDNKDIQRALDEMDKEGLIKIKDSSVILTEQGVKLGKDWQHFLLKREPILEVIAGLTDGSITGLVVVLSALIGKIGFSEAIFAAFLTLAAVAITNFSSFFLGGVTEDYSDMITLENLLQYSLSDIPDKKERNKSLKLLEQLITLLRDDIRKSNILSAVICGATTFFAGSIPIAFYLYLPEPLDVILSLGVVAFTIGIFLIQYRAKQAHVKLRITFIETALIIGIAVIASLILGVSI